jgi:hypothetical protein
VESGTAVLARAKRSALVDAENTEFEERAAGTHAAAPKGFERNAGAAWLEDETADRAEAQPPLVDMGDGLPLVDRDPKAELLNAEEKGLDMVWSRKAPPAAPAAAICGNAGGGPSGLMRGEAGDEGAGAPETMEANGFICCCAIA